MTYGRGSCASCGGSRCSAYVHGVTCDLSLDESSTGGVGEWGRCSVCQQLERIEGWWGLHEAPTPRAGRIGDKGSCVGCCTCSCCFSWKGESSKDIRFQSGGGRRNVKKNGRRRRGHVHTEGESDVGISHGCVNALQQGGGWAHCNELAVVWGIATCSAAAAAAADSGEKSCVVVLVAGSIRLRGGAKC